MENSVESIDFPFQQEYNYIRYTCPYFVLFWQAAPNIFRRAKGRRGYRVKFKRLAGLLLAIALVAGSIPAASAAGSAKVSLSSGTVKAGGSVTLTVSIKDNPGLAVWMLYFYYDTDVFTVDPGTDMKAGGKFASGGSLVGNTIAKAKENGRYDGRAGKDGAIALWYGASNVSESGNLMTITFHVDKDAPNGTYSIGLGYSPDNCCNELAESVSLSTSGGTITVTGGTSGGSSSSGDYEEIPAFTDVDGHWAYDYIVNAAELELMEGTGNGLFKPDKTLTRAEFVTVLWRAMGEPRAKKAATFTDLKGDWYKDAVAWAQENDIIKGTGGTEFEPDGTISREQVAVILHRLAGSPTGMEIMFGSMYDNQYTDSGKISPWAKASLYWALNSQIYCGVTSEYVRNNKLAPLDDATRAQIAVMMVRYLDNQGGI